jgi:hypothetical protein
MKLRKDKRKGGGGEEIRGEDTKQIIPTDVQWAFSTVY